MVLIRYMAKHLLNKTQNECMPSNFCIFGHQIKIMKKLIFLLALLPALLSAQNDCESSFVWGCVPTLEYNPVCGCDEVTYPNPSAAACNSITEYTMGACGVTIVGCTDSLSLNYNPLATEDDGSCIDTDIPGCTDSLALNYPGCTDEDAFNYNPIATEDDGSCLYPVFGCMDATACNYNPEAEYPDFSCEFAEEFYDCDGICLSDGDSDGVCDEIDNCINTQNPDQSDYDGDDEGDACDYDDGLDINELESDQKTLVKMIDILGRDYTYHPKGRILC